MIFFRPTCRNVVFDGLKRKNLSMKYEKKNNNNDNHTFSHVWKCFNFWSFFPIICCSSLIIASLAMQKCGIFGTGPLVRALLPHIKRNFEGMSCFDPKQQNLLFYRSFQEQCYQISHFGYYSPNFNIFDSQTMSEYEISH